MKNHNPEYDPIIPTPEQNSIINFSRGKHVVYASAGSGKTEMLSLRVKTALNNGICPEEMICLTFTNKAALNMQSRIKNVEKVFIGNIHSFGSQFLFFHKLIPKQTIILDEAEMLVLLNDARNEVLSLDNELSEVSYDKNLQANLLFINWKNQIKWDLPKDVISKSKELLLMGLGGNMGLQTKKEEFLRIYHQYEILKKEFMALDFDDLLNLTYHFLHGNSDTNKSFSWIQVDEFQDLNLIQWSILKNLMKRDSHMVLFGDTQQAIFSFMGADSNAVETISESCQKHYVYQNHRSPQYLLDLYNDFTKHNLNPLWKKKPYSIDTTINKNNLVFQKVQGDQYLELNYILKEFIIPHIQSNKNPITVLMGTNRQVSFMSSLCINYNINHFPVSSFDLFDRKIIKDFFAFYKGIIGSKNRLDWVRIFSLFTGSSLKLSRNIINEMFKVGLHPIDFTTDKENKLEILQKILTNGRIIILDTETTGLDTEKDDVIQIAALEIIKGKRGKSLNTYLKTEKPLGESTKIHNITKEFLKINGVGQVEAIKSFLKFIGDDPLLAHNINFDISILSCFISRLGLSFNVTGHNFDSIDLTKRLYPAFNSFELGYIVKELNLEGNATHNAFDDVLATASLVLHLKEIMIKNQYDRIEFINTYKSTLNKFREKAETTWQNNLSKLYQKYPVYKLLEDFIKLWSKPLKIQEENAINKLNRYFKNEWNDEINLIDFLKTKFSTISKLKESDLILGDESVVISTIHRAKGLEWDTVIIPSCTDDNFPNYPSKMEAQKNPSIGKEIIREEAKKLYVAMTRSKKTLIITYSSFKKVSSGRLFHQSVSRFLETVLHHFNK